MTTLLRYYEKLIGSQNAISLLIEEAASTEYLVKPHAGEECGPSTLEVKLVDYDENGMYKAKILKIDPSSDSEAGST